MDNSVDLSILSSNIKVMEKHLSFEIWRDLY